MTLVNFNVAETLSSFQCTANVRELLHDKVADDGPDPPWRRNQRESGLTEDECSHFHQDTKFASHPMGMWLFCWVRFFFSETYQGCSPIFLLDLSAGHTNEVGGASSRHVP